MLASYRLIETSDVNEIEAAWIENSRGRNVDMSGVHPANPFVASLARFDDGALTHCRYDAPIAVSFEAADYTRLIYQMRRGSAVLLEGETSEIVSSRAGCLIPAGRRWHGRHGVELEDLAVRVPTATLQRKLSAYLGSDRQALDLLQPSAADPQRAEELRQTIFRLTAAVENVDDRFLPSLAVTSLDEISVGLFTCFSLEVLAAEQKAAAPSAVQLGRVEQYLVAHYTEPVTLEILAAISGVSARSIIWYFRSRYGYTPQQYLERVRLQMAHLQLRIFSGNSVECVALQCGFPSVAAFRCSYIRQFGVPPIPRYSIN
ncbi:MAG TPA: AraC family transcriptional regulator [Bradyrhizobium sp.]|nr:AraC family transcriptional regulator [Bradyrhizobium sp.]